METRGHDLTMHQPQFLHHHHLQVADHKTHGDIDLGPLVRVEVGTLYGDRMLKGIRILYQGFHLPLRGFATSGQGLLVTTSQAMYM